MSLVISGTVPIRDLPLLTGSVELKEHFVKLDGHEIPCTMGTAAMVSAACRTCEAVRIASPTWITAGDIGDSKGSRLIYNYLIDKLASIKPSVLSLHYLMPITVLATKLIDSFGSKKPVLIADAGSMYVMKSIGASREFDLFTPDPGEMAFLADPSASHPAYMQRFLFEQDTVDVPRLVEQAYKHGNASRVLLVKGAKDYVAKEGRIVAVIEEPFIPTLEPIGGTGDTVTGIASALVSYGMEVEKAAITAARTNRVAGKLANPSTATKVREIIVQIPKALEQCMNENAKTQQDHVE